MYVCMCDSRVHHLISIYIGPMVCHTGLSNTLVHAQVMYTIHHGLLAVHFNVYNNNMGLATYSIVSLHKLNHWTT